jgi:hypothetical protein
MSSLPVVNDVVATLAERPTRGPNSLVTAWSSGGRFHLGLINDSRCQEFSVRHSPDW